MYLQLLILADTKWTKRNSPGCKIVVDNPLFFTPHKKTEPKNSNLYIFLKAFQTPEKGIKQEFSVNLVVIWQNFSAILVEIWHKFSRIKDQSLI